MEPSASSITVGKIDTSNIRVVQVEKDLALRDLATKEIVGFSALKFLRIGPPYFDHTYRPPWYKRLFGDKAQVFRTGTFYVDRSSDEEYQRMLEERRKGRVYNGANIQN